LFHFMPLTFYFELIECISFIFEKESFEFKSNMLLNQTREKEKLLKSKPFLGHPAHAAHLGPVCRCPYSAP
jgi:hypothetical protein